jgi:hypothetical protein
VENYAPVLKLQMQRRIVRELKWPRYPTGYAHRLPGCPACNQQKHEDDDQSNTKQHPVFLQICKGEQHNRQSRRHIAQWDGANSKVSDQHDSEAERRTPAWRQGAAS